MELENGNYVLYDRQNRYDERRGVLQPVFFNGEMKRIDSLDTIRARVAEELSARLKGSTEERTTNAA